VPALRRAELMNKLQGRFMLELSVAWLCRVWGLPISLTCSAGAHQAMDSLILVQTLEKSCESWTKFPNHRCLRVAYSETRATDRCGSPLKLASIRSTGCREWHPDGVCEQVRL
jgi:hypothetical protein